MEEDNDRAWLGPWILGPLVLFVVMIFATFLLPSVDCDFSDDEGGAGRTAFAVIAGLGSLLAGAAAIYRLATMRRQRVFAERDGLLGGLALLLVCIAAGSSGGDSEDALGWALAAGFLLMIVCFVALLIAAAVDKGLDDVGVLVPLYLIGAALAYPFIAWLVLDFNSGALC